MIPSELGTSMRYHINRSTSTVASCLFDSDILLNTLSSQVAIAEVVAVTRTMTGEGGATRMTTAVDVTIAVADVMTGEEDVTIEAAAIAMIAEDIKLCLLRIVCKSTTPCTIVRSQEGEKISYVSPYDTH